MINVLEFYPLLLWHNDHVGRNWYLNKAIKSVMRVLYGLLLMKRELFPCIDACTPEIQLTTLNSALCLIRTISLDTLHWLPRLNSTVDSALRIIRSFPESWWCRINRSWLTLQTSTKTFLQYNLSATFKLNILCTLYVMSVLSV